ncbi:hypothetical protein DIPPA_11164 [Diplonema papillatum]|nr:hypothetical protein DIPPA_11164 [Diplonema papillatum]
MYHWIDKADTTCTGADLPLWLWLAAGFGLFVLAALLLCLLRQRRRRRRGANRRGENAAPLFPGPAVGKSPAGPSITRQSSQLTAASRPHTPCGSVVVDGDE